MKFTLIIRTINGQYIRTEHYTNKADALIALCGHIEYGYVVEMMKYSIYRDDPNKWERKLFTIVEVEA